MSYVPSKYDTSCEGTLNATNKEKGQRAGPQSPVQYLWVLSVLVRAVRGLSELTSENLSGTSVQI